MPWVPLCTFSQECSFPSFDRNGHCVWPIPGASMIGVSRWKVHKIPSQTDTTYQVGLRIFSRAGRVAQRANGAWIYLIDSDGRRFSPDPDPSTVPLDTELQPKESLQTTRTFHVPADARQLGLITGHGGAYCGLMSFLVMGDSGCVFHKPSIVQID
jgi:hypothetical protein